MIKEIIEGGWVSGWPEMLVAAIVAVCIFDLLQQLRQALKDRHKGSLKGER